MVESDVESFEVEEINKKGKVVQPFLLSTFFLIDFCYSLFFYFC